MMRVVVLAGLHWQALLSPVRRRPRRSSTAGRVIGMNVPGSSKCATYKMTIDVTVDGDSVKGLFQQEGRPGAQLRNDARQERRHQDRGDRRRRQHDGSLRPDQEGDKILLNGYW